MSQPTHTAHYSALFTQHLSETNRAEIAALEDLERRLSTLLQNAWEAWPQLPHSDEELLEHIATRLERFPPKRGIADWLDHTRADDLLLALCCANALPEALHLFETTFHSDLRRLTARYQGPTLPAEDLLQSLREKLFVSTPKRHAKILDYSGQGKLRNWIKVTGTRTFIDLLRSQSKRDKEETTPEEDQIMRLPDVSADLELDFLKREYRGHFKEAFAAATQTLTSHERNLLRQHLVSKLTVHQLGRVYGVHASTISRRIAKARENLLKATREELTRRLNISHSEFDSIMHLIRSRLDLSMHRLLKTVTPE